MSVVAITGVAGFLGHRLLSRLEAAPDVTRIVGIDLAEPMIGSSKLEFHQMDVRDARLPKVLVGVDVVAHLAFASDPGRDVERMRSVNVDGTRNVFESAAAIGARKLVYTSSTTVYGAHPDNPVPLTESAPLRANPDFAYAAHKLEIERMIEVFRAKHPDIDVAVLRAAIVLGRDVENFVSRMLEAPRLLAVREHAPPLQFVHEDDVADALALAVRSDLDGVYNLAADGWMDAAEIDALTGKRRVELPVAVAFSLAERLWRIGLTSAPPGELHYVMYPWVADNSKLRAAGWTPVHTNRDALAETVAAHRAWLTLGRARVRKDSLAKGAAATLGALGAVALVRRGRRRRGR
jgi:nucleoside-diphosphate-sugar epimerase